MRKSIELDIMIQNHQIHMLRQRVETAVTAVSGGVWTAEQGADFIANGNIPGVVTTTPDENTDDAD